MSRELGDREVVRVVQSSQSGSVVVNCAEDGVASSEAAARARASGSLSSVLGPRATRISVTSYEEEATPPPGGIEKLCMIVDRFESDARRISRGSMLDAEGASSPTIGGGGGAGPATRQPHPRKASHQPARSPRLSPRPPLAGQRSHHDLMLLSPNSRAKGSGPVTSFVESVRKSSFSSKMAEIFDGDSPTGGGGFSVVSCAAAAAVSEVAATVAVNCTAATDDEDDEGEDDDRLIGGGGSEVTWRVASSISSSSSSASSADHASSMSKKGKPSPRLRGWIDNRVA